MKIQKYKKVASTLFTNNRSVRMRDGLRNNGTGVLSSDRVLSSYSASTVSIPTSRIKK